MLELIHIYYLSIRRSSLFEAKLANKVLTFFGIIYLSICLVFIGFFLDRFLSLIEPEFIPIDTFSRFFLFIFAIDIILKFFMKSYKQIDIFPYLTLPISRKKIYTLLFIKELLSKWNFIWVIVLTPFFFKTMYPANGLVSVLLLIFSAYFISVVISFFNRYMDVLSIWKSFLYTFSPLILSLFIGCVAYYIATTSQLLININWVFSQCKSWVFIGLIVLFSSLFIIFQKSCKRELYIQVTGKNKSILSFNFKWLDSFGLMGEIMKLCLKEVMRSPLKRNLLLSLLFFIYGLFIFNFRQGHFFIRCILTMAPTILLGSTLGQLSFGLESTFFDKLMSSPKNIPYLIIQAKYAICVLFSLFCTIIYSLVYINKIPLLFWISIFFYGCSFLFFIFQNVAYNKQRIDLFAIPKFPKSTVYDFLTIGIMIVLQGVIYLIYWLTSETTVEYFMLITGIVNMKISPLWLKNIYKRFLIRRYPAMYNFRNC